MIEGLLSAVVRWATAHPDVLAVALVGSHARGCATPTSDVDLVVIAVDPQRFLQETDWTTAFGVVTRQAVEHWGVVTSLRVWYEGGPEVEFGLTGAEWVAEPLDAGTRQVVSEGIRVLFDREGLLASAVRRSPPEAWDECM